MPHRETDISERLDNLESSAYDRRYIDPDGVALADILPTDLQLESVTAGAAGAFVILSWMGWQPEVETFEIWLEAPDQPAEKIGEFATSPATLTINVKVDTPVVLTVRARAGDRTVGFAQSPSVAALIPAPISSALGPNSVGDSHLIHVGTDRIVIKDADILNLNANKLNAGTIDAGVISVINLNASNINAGTLDASVVNVVKLNATNIKSGTLDASEVNIINFAVPEILAGAGAPNDANGKNGDTYIQADGAVWRKVAGAWSDTGINLSGADSTAVDGADGATIQSGDVAAGATPSGSGITVGDIFIATDGRWWRWGGTAWVFRGDLTGRDGPGSEWVFRITTTNVAPALVQLVSAKMQLADQVPTNWSDDPQGVDATNEFEWVARRARSSAGSWSEFSIPTLWAVYRKDGTNASNINRGTLNAGIVNVTNINASNINAGTLNAALVNVINLNADNITAGTITGINISGSLIKGGMIKGGTITGGTITGTTFKLGVGTQSMEINRSGFLQKDSFGESKFVYVLNGSIYLGTEAILRSNVRIRIDPSGPAYIQIRHRLGVLPKPAVELTVSVPAFATPERSVGIIRTYKSGTSRGRSAVTAELFGGVLKLYKADGTVGITLDPEVGIVHPADVIGSINYDIGIETAPIEATGKISDVAINDAQDFWLKSVTGWAKRGSLAPGRTDGEIQALTSVWAHEGDISSIPADKLTLAPGGSGVYFRGSGETLTRFPPPATFGVNLDVAFHSDGRIVRKREGAWAGVSLVIPRPTALTAVFESISNLVHALDVKWSGGNYMAEIDVGYVPTRDIRNLTGAVWGAHTAVSAASYYRFRRIYQPVPDGRAVRVRFIGAFGQRGPWAYALYVTSSALYISSFTSNKPSIRVGESVTLSWEVRNAVSASIDQNVGPIASAHRLSGSVIVSPIARTTYTLTVVKGEETLTRTVTIAVLAPLRQPSITSFAADDATILTTETTTIRWAAVNGVSGTIKGTRLNRALTSAELTAGTLDVGPLTDGAHTYTLTIIGEAGSTTATDSFIIIVSEPTPVVTPSTDVSIDSFTASRTNIQSGEQTTLTWETSNATSVRLSIFGRLFSGSDESLDGFKVVTPTASVTYRISASGPGGPLTKDIRITVTARPPVTVTPDPPVIDSFIRSESSIVLGESVTLTWMTTDALRVSINKGVGSVALDGNVDVTPTETGTSVFTITATGASGTTAVTAQVSVKVNARSVVAPSEPVINSFTRNPATIVLGETITFVWRTTDAVSVSIDKGVAGNLAVDGTVDFTPTAAGIIVFILTATGVADTTPVTQSVSVTVNTVAPVVDPPVIDTFTRSAATIVLGESFDLVWTTTDAVRVNLLGVSANLALDGQRSITPRTTGTKSYKLTAHGETGTSPVTATVSVKVNPVPVVVPDEPVIDSFTRTPSTITLGDAITFNWRTTDALSVKISGGVGTGLAVDGTKDFTPLSTGTFIFTLTATGAANTTPDTQSVSVTVNPVPVVIPDPPVIDSFTRSRASIALGQSVTLTWRTTDALSVDINNGVGTGLSADGSKNFTPPSTGNYEFVLTARGVSGTTAVTATVSVRVIAVVLVDEPVIDSFTRGPSSIFLNQPITFTWRTTDATSVSIDGDVGSGLALDGNKVFTPTSVGIFSFILTATGAAGSTPDTQTVSVTVKVRPDTPTIDSFSVSPSNVQNQESVVFTWTTSDTRSQNPCTLTGVGVVPADGDKTLRIGGTPGEKIFTLTAYGEVGAQPRIVQQSVTITIDEPPEIVDPVIDSFSISSSSVFLGDSVTLTWTTSDAIRVHLSTVGNVTLDGNRTIVTVSTSRTGFTLTAYGESGSTADTAEVSITVKARPPQPVIDTFGSSASSAEAGQIVTLSWLTTNATRVHLSGVGNVDLDGAKEVTLINPGTKRYTLTAYGPAGTTSVRETISITVTRPNPTG